MGIYWGYVMIFKLVVQFLFSGMLMGCYRDLNGNIMVMNGCIMVV
jgi:hypothetical protein